ncbi:DUF3108 domain-containing protein [Alteromonas halophila]|uniref:DUF3108 domain-containing protein n=1 Tax=Alteromonas halophila TaxID=516698 RepID=A0A918JQH1_9ALTE|nr:DUF3108 domain-containing protein [Alteromonas halophila]GGW95847.1 hypothetical protein GCM10007391_32520 [Alteromonas halophila]
MKNFPKLVTQAIKPLTVSLALLFPAAVIAADEAPLTPFHAVYTAYKWGDDVGTAEMTLKKLSPAQYSLTYSSHVSKFFLSDKRYEHSIFDVADGELVPDEYHYSRSGTGPDKKLSVRFEGGENPTITVDNEKTMAWQGELDNQIYRIELPRQLAAGAEASAFDFINYRGQQRHYGVKVLGEETLTLPYGKLDTIKVKLVRDSNKRETFIWFAPELDYNLVRLQQFKDGDEQGDIKLKSYTRH